jgi:hypothetical protein
MNAVDNTFFGAFLKVQRANYHINEIMGHSQPLASHLFEITWIKAIGLPCGSSYAPVSSDPESQVVELAFLPKQPIREYFALMIGDAIHNLRTALDYAATAIVRAAEHDTSFVTFPFHEERQDLVAPQSKGIRQIQAALPNADVEGFFKNTVKAYRDGNLPLWTISKLDKIDKHNFILPTVSTASAFNPIMGGQSGNINFMSVGSITSNDASQPFGLLRMDAANGLPNHDHVQVSCDIAFPYGQFFSGLPVVPTLTNASEVVLEALKALERFAIDNGIYDKSIFP